MTSPVGSSPPPIMPEPPVVVINIPSPTIFGIIRGMVGVIHATHMHQIHFHRTNHIQPERNFRPLGSVLSNPDNMTDPDTEINLPSSSMNYRERSETPRADSVNREIVPPQESKGERLRVELPRNFEVPDLTDHSRRSSKDEKAKYQRMVMEMLERVARIVKEMNVAKEVEKGDNQKDVSDSDPFSKSEANKNLEASTQVNSKTAASNNDVSLSIKKTGVKEEADVTHAIEEIPKSAKDVHHVDLIIETVDQDGLIEQIPVERGEISDLVDNLHLILNTDAELPTSVQEALNLMISTLDPAAESKSEQTQAKKGPQVDKQAGVPPQLKSPKNNLPQNQSTDKTVTVPTNAFIRSTGVSASAVASMASFMPYNTPNQNKQVGIDKENGYKVDTIEKEGGANRFGADNTETRDSKKIPAETAAVDKTSRKSARQKEVQGVADNASKDQRAKKTPTQRIDDDRIVPVHGKFTVEQLKSVRRRRAKGEGGGAGKGAETHRLIDVLYMILCAVVCGAQTVFDITTFIESREKWFTTVLGLKNGLPSTKLLNKLLVGFKAAQLSDMLRLWMREAQGAPLRSGLISIMISETFEGVIFAQERTGAASTAELCLPQIVQFFEIRGAVLLLSNGKAAKKIFNQIVENGAHFIYDCGEETIPLETQVLPLFEQAINNPQNTEGVAYTESYVEGQEYLQLFETNLEELEPPVRTVAQVLTQVITDDGKDETVQYFISSLPKQSVWLFELLRTQRNLESKTEWTANMSLRGKHGDEAAFAVREFLAIIRRYATNLLLKDQSYKAPIFAKQQRAAKETDYLMKILAL